MKNKILIIITFLAGTLLFNSCLKDKYGEDWTASLQGKMYAELPNNGLQSNTITPDPTDQDLRFLVNIATDAVPTSDITLTLAIDPAALAAYNTANGTSFVLYPTLTLVNPTITIKAGTRNNYVHVTLKSANLLALSTAWMVPLSITAVNGAGAVIADNKKTVLMKLPIANKWEGKYAMQTGSSFSDLLNPTFFLNIPANFALETYGPTSVIVHDLSTSSAGGYARLVWSAPGSGTYYGTFCAVYNIDPATNKITSVINSYGQPTAGNGRSAAIDPTGVNTYNPATKTFDVTYNCLQPGTTVRLKFHDILKYTGSL